MSEKKMKEILAKYSMIQQHRRNIVHVENILHQKTKNKLVGTNAELGTPSYQGDAEGIEPFSVHPEVSEPFSVNI